MALVPVKGKTWAHLEASAELLKNRKIWRNPVYSTCCQLLRPLCHPFNDATGHGNGEDVLMALDLYFYDL